MARRPPSQATHALIRERQAEYDPNADEPDVEPNPEPDDVDAPTPAHPDTTPDDDEDDQ